jgi:hypothetical protein
MHIFTFPSRTESAPLLNAAAFGSVVGPFSMTIMP